MHKKITYIFLFSFLVTACADTFDSVKRGITGQKRKSVDEFLVKKKDPLILPPDFENLPTPDERTVATEEISVFQETLENAVEENSETSSTVENSILKKIQSK